MAHLYNEETISQAIDTKWAGKTVHFAKETDSTNSWIKRLAKDGAEHGTLAVAEFQSAGRGRFDRRWEAPEGSSIMMTLLLRPEFSPQYASMLTLVMGMAVAQAAEELGFNVSIKWPNDIVISKKKICGILTEMGTNAVSYTHLRAHETRQLCSHRSRNQCKPERISGRNAGQSDFTDSGGRS